MYSVQEGASRERYRPSGARPRCSRTGRSQDAFTSAAPIRSLRHLQPIARPASTESTFSSFPPTSLQIAPWPDAGASYVLYRPRACSATRTGRLTAPTPRDTRRFFVLRFRSAPLRVVIARSVSDLTHGAQQQNAIGAFSNFSSTSPCPLRLTQGQRSQRVRGLLSCLRCHQSTAFRFRWKPGP